MATKHGLGRGLGALIKDAAAAPPEEKQGILRIPAAEIRRSPLQPRRRFDEQALGELATSIKRRGVLQPLLVRGAGDGYELIAGERRLRAAEQAGLHDVPAMVIDAADGDALELALVENLQREDLNVVEEAESYRALVERFGLTHEQIGERLGKSRAAVTNTLRVLDLPAEVQALLTEGRLSPGHGKALTGLEIPEEQLRLARRAIQENLSVRNLEKLVQRTKQAPRKPRALRYDIPAAHVNTLADRLQSHFGTGVRVIPSRTYANGKKGKGFIQVDFYSNEDLDRILEILGVSGE